MAETLLASQTVTSSGNTALTTLNHVETVKTALFQLLITAAATGAGDTFDLYLQSSIDGTVWNDFVHFTQVLGNGGPIKFQAAWVRDIVPTVAIGAPKDATLAVGVNQGLVGGLWRAKWVIAGGGPTSFTFSLSMYAQRSR